MGFRESVLCHLGEAASPEAGISHGCLFKTLLQYLSSDFLLMWQESSKIWSRCLGPWKFPGDPEEALDFRFSMIKPGHCSHFRSGPIDGDSFSFSLYLQSKITENKRGRWKLLLGLSNLYYPLWNMAGIYLFSIHTHSKSIAMESL